jgi:hypothetical protein
MVKAISADSLRHSWQQAECVTRRILKKPVAFILASLRGPPYSTRGKSPSTGSGRAGEKARFTSSLTAAARGTARLGLSSAKHSVGGWVKTTAWVGRVKTAGLFDHPADRMSQFDYAASIVGFASRCWM